MAKSRRKKKRRTTPPPAILAALLLLVATGVVLAVLFWPSGETDPDSQGGKTLLHRFKGEVVQGPHIFYTCNIQGRLTPGPSEEAQYMGQLGGMGRLATLYAQWAAEAEEAPILVDVGNATIAAHDDVDAVNEFTCTALEAVGVQYVNCGDNEVAMPLDALTKLANKRKFAMLSANVVRADTRDTVFDPYKIAESGGRKVGIVGLVGDDVPPGRIGRGLRIENPADRLKAVVKSLEGRVDFIVCLAFMSPEQIYKLASKFPEVGLFLGGRADCTSAPYELSSPPGTPRRSLIAYLGDQGRSAGRIEPIFPVEAGDPSANVTVRLLTEDLEDAVPLKSVLADFTRIVRPLPGSDWDEKMPASSMYVGAEVCRICHIKVFYAWKKSEHAGAWVTLLQEKKHKSGECLSCHATGYHMPGGFDPDKVTDDPETVIDDQSEAFNTDATKDEAEKKTEEMLRVRIERKSQQALKSVGCEACHGGARRHLGMALKNRASVITESQLRTSSARKSCIRCHTGMRPCQDPEKSDPFYLQEYLEKIRHWD